MRIHYSRIFFSRNPSYDEFVKYTARENFALYGTIAIIMEGLSHY